MFCVLAGSAFAASAAAPAPAADNAADAAERAASAAAKRRAERADYQLLYAYPDEATHRKLKLAELEVVKGHLHQAGLRLDELLAKRKGLIEKAEFYRGKALPATLQAQMDESDASLTASMYVFRGLEQESVASSTSTSGRAPAWTSSGPAPRSARWGCTTQRSAPEK